MAQTAREEGFDEVADWFESLVKAELSHASRYQKAMAQFETANAPPSET
jgi:rubrerythrin